jgi:hypothetical protein
MLLIQQNFDLAEVTVRARVVEPAAAPSILEVYIDPEVESHIKHLLQVV